MTSRNRDWWRAHLQCIEREGLTTKAYADREGIAPASLYYWRKTLKAEAGSEPLGQESIKSKFMAVTLADTQTADPLPGKTAHCCLILPSGLRLEMSSLPSARWLMELGQSLAQASR